MRSRGDRGPGRRRKRTTQSTALPSAKEQAGSSPPTRVTECPNGDLAARAAEAIKIASVLDEAYSDFFRGWVGFNHYYNGFRGGSERERVITAVENGLQEHQAEALLHRFSDDIRYLERLPPGNLRLAPEDRRFRAQAAADLERAGDSAVSARRRFGYVIAAIYQVRCNLFHGGKRPGRPRDDTLVDIGRRFLDGLLHALYENVGSK